VSQYIVEAETKVSVGRATSDERNRLADLTMTWPAEAQGIRRCSVRGALGVAVLLRHLNPDSRRALREHPIRHVGGDGHASMVLGHWLPVAETSHMFLV
jgi:hypothetical protein